MSKGRRVSRTQFRYTTYEADIAEDNPVRFVDYFVDSLDMEALGCKQETNQHVGRPIETYASDLLKLILYGACNELDSSRDMERACKINVEVRWLMHGSAPSYAMISTFRKNNINCFDDVFHIFTDMLIDHFGLSFQTIDGSKFKASNSKDSNFTLHKIDDRIAWKQQDLADLERRIRAFEPNYVLPSVEAIPYSPDAKPTEKKTKKTADNNTQLSMFDDPQAQIEAIKEAIEEDEQQEAQQDEDAQREEPKDQEEKDAEAIRKATLDKLKEQVKKKSELLAKHLGYRQYMEDNHLSQLSLTDPTSKLMKSKNGYIVAYNVQALVDSETHLITEILVTTEPGDTGQIYPLVSKYKKRRPKALIHVAADKGYQSAEDMALCLESGVIPHVITGPGVDGYDVEFPYVPLETAGIMLASEDPAVIAQVLRSGNIPKIYAEVLSEPRITSKNIYDHELPSDVSKMTDDEMREFAAKGYFVRNLETDRVYCPAGVILRKKSEKRNGNIRYTNKNSCRECKFRHKGYCATGKTPFKEVDFADKVTTIRCRKWLNDENEDETEQSDEDKEALKAQLPKPKKKLIGTRQIVIMKLKPDRAKTEKRFSIAEHPFGTMKIALGREAYNLRGLQKVSGEQALTAWAYNFKIAFNLLGFKGLWNLWSEAKETAAK